MTAATDLADYLTAVASHLRTNPDLHPVNVPAHRVLQLTSTDTSAIDLTAWADSLTDVTAMARPWNQPKEYPRAASVWVTGKTATGVELTVWDVVNHMKKPLGFTRDTNPYEKVPFDVALLRARAAAEAEQAAIDAKADES